MYFGKRLRELRLFCYQSWQIDEFFTRKTWLRFKKLFYQIRLKLMLAYSIILMEKTKKQMKKNGTVLR